MSCSFEPYFYFVFGVGDRTDFLIEKIKTIKIIGKSKNFSKSFTIGIHDKAIMLILSYINTN